MKLMRMGKNHPVCAKSSAALATLLLDTSLKFKGFLGSEKYYGTIFEQPGVTYEAWIIQLKRAGLLEHYREEGQLAQKSDWIRYKAGPVMLQYIDEEKRYRDEVASMRDVYDLEERIESKKADRSELEDLKVRMNEIAVAVRELQDASIPPDSAEKKHKRENAMAKIVLRAVSN
jgi:hypothetical protein